MIEAVAISPDGRHLAATEGTRLHVFDTQTGAGAQVQVGAADESYGRGPAFSPTGGLLVLDRERIVLVYSVQPG